jgi:D-alanine-D-alanine ligase
VRVLILHNAILHNTADEKSAPHERDVLDQVREVEVALAALGCEITIGACTLDLDAVARLVEATAPDLVFNLVESLGGQDRLIPLVPALLEALGVPFTGCSARALFVTTDKVWAKEVLARAGLPTPETFAIFGVPETVRGRVAEAPANGYPAVIVKSLLEHGSLGLDADAVLAPGSDLDEALPRLAPRFGGACLAERYVAGREINVALLEGLEGFEGVAVLAPSEILFEGFAQGQPRIVGYRAKWDAASFEYHATPRRLGLPAPDAALDAELRRLSLRCWDELRLSGWARVDFRVDELGRPFVLEVNANPCLSADAGFRAALDHAAIPFPRAIAGLLEVARRRSPRPTATTPPAAS